jgi:hypothetical protein
MLLIYVFCFVGNAFPQATSGTILGQVTDAQSAAISEATVTAKNEGTGLTQKVETNSNGDYMLANLPPGTYTVTVSRDGFTTAVSSGNVLVIDQKLRLDIQLSVGVISDSVNVTAE